MEVGEAGRGEGRRRRKEKGRRRGREENWKRIGVGEEG